MSAPLEIPLRPDIDTLPHFQAAADGRLAVPCCDDCSAFHWYPSQQCPSCHGWNISWPTLSGEGEVFSFVVVEHALLPNFADQVPYVLALVDLPDAPGVRLVSNLLDIEPGDAHIGTPLQAVFETVDDGLGLVRFRPA